MRTNWGCAAFTLSIWSSLEKALEAGFLVFWWWETNEGQMQDLSQDWSLYRLTLDNHQARDAKAPPQLHKPSFSGRFPQIISGPGCLGSVGQWQAGSLSLDNRQWWRKHCCCTNFPPASIVNTMKQITLLFAIFSLGSAEIATFSLPSPWSYTCDRS